MFQTEKSMDLNFLINLHQSAKMQGPIIDIMNPQTSENLASMIFTH